MPIASEQRLRPQFKLITLFIAVSLACAVAGFWRVSPDGGEWNLLVTATSIAFLIGLLSARGAWLGVVAGALFIVVYLLTIFEPDPSGLGPVSIVMPIQLAAATVPMAVAAWCGRRIATKVMPTDQSK